MASERVLVVDDDPAIRSICSRLLESDSYQVETASNAEEALRLLFNGEFDLLLTDIRLPGITGLELARRARERGLEITIVAMTGFSSLETAIQALSLGVDEFIVKPFAMDALRRTLTRALEKNRLRQENARLKALMPLFENARSFVSATTREQLRARVVEAVAKTVPADAVVLLETDQENSLLTLVAACGGDFAGRIGEVISFQDAAAQVLLHIDQVQVWRGDDATGIPLELGARGEAMIIGVTLLSHGRQLGFLLARANPGVTFTVSDAEALTILGGQATTALENAQLIQELRTAYQGLQNLDHLKSEFINIAAHELRTPLSVLMGYALMMAEQLRGTEREQLRYILANAERLHRIVDNMFSLRFLEHGQAELYLETFDAARALRAVIEAYRGLASRKEQTVALDLAEGLGQITADHSLFDLMIGNLLSNAIKFSGRASPIRVKAWSDVNQITFVVRDQGRGLTPAEQAKIFDRFYQASESLTREEGGLGLGLAITRAVVRSHHGKIWVESEPGKGSAFYISLPRRAEPGVVQLGQERS